MSGENITEPRNTEPVAPSVPRRAGAKAHPGEGTGVGGGSGAAVPGAAPSPPPKPMVRDRRHFRGVRTPPQNPKPQDTTQSVLCVPLNVFRDRGCRYLIGDAPAARYCNTEVVPGKPYCPEHHAVCYVPAPSKGNTDGA